MMDFRIILSVLSVIYSGVFHTALPASLGEVSTRHSRPKRCSCATFLDKECVYFCHLDIIWVNTPEHTVSYGLGNAPRKKRSVHEVARAVKFLRCECTDSTDGTCVAFCRARNQPRSKAAHDKVIPSAGGHDCAEKKRKHDLAAKTSVIKGRRKGSEPSVARATRQLQLLLKEWSLSHITQVRAAENTTSTTSDTRHRTSQAMWRKGLRNPSPEAASV